METPSPIVVRTLLSLSTPHDRTVVGCRCWIIQHLWKRKDGGEGLTWLLSRINVRVDGISKRQQET